MQSKTIAAVWDSKLAPGTKLVALAWLEVCGEISRPSQSMLDQVRTMCCLEPDQAERAIARLREECWIVTEDDGCEAFRPPARGERAAAAREREAAAPTLRGVNVWEAYSAAYKLRYQTDPVRDARANAVCKGLVARLGEEAAPQVAAFYVSHNDQAYVRSCHALEFLARDAPKLHTQWKTGRADTSVQARQVEGIDAVAQAREQARALLRRDRQEAQP